MGQKLSAKDLALYRAVDEVLHYVGDPIRVSGIPESRDEYLGYVPAVFGMLRDGADEAKVIAYLTSIATERMGLSARPEHDREVASVLLDWREYVHDQQV